MLIKLDFPSDPGKNGPTGSNRIFSTTDTEYVPISSLMLNSQSDGPHKSTSAK